MFSFFKKSNIISLKAPFQGEIVDITEVNDPAFSEKMIGDGVAIKPINNTAIAPCDGNITSIFPTNHAFGITTKDGLEILVHIGIDTVKLKGKGFKRLVEAGSDVKKGTAIMEVDLDYLKKCEIDIITPVVVTNMDKLKSLDKDFNNSEEILKILVNK